MEDTDDVSPRLLSPKDHAHWAPKVPRGWDMRTLQCPNAPLPTVGVGSVVNPPTKEASIDDALQEGLGDIKAWYGAQGKIEGPPAATGGLEAATTEVLSRLAARLRQGAAVVEQQEREKARLAAEVVSEQHHAAERRAGLEARVSAAEAQLQSAHDALCSAQHAHREAAATAAELQERLTTVSVERQNLEKELQVARDQERDARTLIVTITAEKDAAVRSADESRAAVAAADVRIRRAEVMEESIRVREASLADARATLEENSASVRNATRQCERREAEVGLRERRVEAREKALGTREAGVARLDNEIRQREAAAVALVSKFELERGELDRGREAVRLSREAVAAREIALRESEAALSTERSELESRIREASIECGRAAARAAASKKEAEDAEKKAADAEAAARAAYERVMADDRRWADVIARCGVEEQRLKELERQREGLVAEVEALKRKSDAAEENERARRDALEATRREVETKMEKLQSEVDTIAKERALLEERLKSLNVMEEQAREAAEDAKRQQVILACTRRDSAAAAAEMQRRHIEAAAQLEGPGGAADASYESIRMESVVRLARDLSTTVTEAATTAGNDVRNGKARCKQASADVRRSLDEWRARLLSSGVEGQRKGRGNGPMPCAYGSPPEEEPSLGETAVPQTCTQNKPWPAIFSYGERG